MWLKSPFNMILCGPTCCGKTEFVLHLLTTEYRGVFDYIIIICPTFVNNAAYNKSFIRSDSDIIIVIPSLDSVDKYLRLIHNTYKNTNSLLIIDDCAASRDLKRRSDELVNLGFSARHDGLSVWVITQQYTSITKPFRENIGMLVLFYTPNKTDLETIIKEYSMELTIDEIKFYMKTLKKTQYSKLIFRLRYPYTIQLC